MPVVPKGTSRFREARVFADFPPDCNTNLPPAVGAKIGPFVADGKRDMAVDMGEGARCRGFHPAVITGGAFLRHSP